jgi:hypothetical protein
VLIHLAKIAHLLSVVTARPFFVASMLMMCTVCRAQGPVPDVPHGPVPAASSSAVPRSTSIVGRAAHDRPLSSLNASIKHSAGDMPPNLAAKRLGDAGVLFDSFDDSRPWMVINEFEWDAPATRHLPLFFEEPNLERLGYTRRCYLDCIGYETDPLVAELAQPLVSAAHFFCRIPFVPYICGVEPPGEPIYTLGVDRPGSPVFYREHLIPISLKGAAFQVGVVCGLAFGIP